MATSSSCLHQCTMKNFQTNGHKPKHGTNSPVKSCKVDIQSNVDEMKNLMLKEHWHQNGMQQVLANAVKRANSDKNRLTET